jgi:hypothetical protein
MMARLPASRSSRLPQQVLIFTLFLISGLALARLLYEGVFPRALWLARPLPTVLTASAVALLGWLGWQRLAHKEARTELTWAFLPLLLNLLYLFNPAVDLSGSRFIFAASVWLTAVLLARLLAPATWWPWLGLLFLLSALLPIYLLTLPDVVGRADTFEFQVVVPTLGIAHPTGYPLYILLGRLFAALPLGSMAWRVNLASAVFALLAASLLYLTGRRLLGRDVLPLPAAVFFGLTPTMWSQAVVAEVYALHALIITAVLWLLILMLDRAPPSDTACVEVSPPWPRLVMALAFLLGLGLTNHLTTLFLLPPALLTVGMAYGRCLRARSWRANVRLSLLTMAAFLLPLALYAYLPLRWEALHDEPMGLSRFIDWVIGGRFQGALQLDGWLTDPARYQIVGRLLLANWGWFNLAVAGLGLAYIIWRNWRAALVLGVTWLGFIFYALNYYVPDLAVFLIPAHIVIALFWGAGLTAVWEAVSAWLGERRPSAAGLLQITLLLLLLVPMLMRTAAGWPAANRPSDVALQTWGAGVLDLPLPQGAAILADSEKIAPLYYLQQAEGVRPDLEIMVLPDEAAYRSQLDARVAAGRPVFLARFLPGLEGIYYLRSFGPLLQVSQEPQAALPPTVVPAQLNFDGLRLLAYEVEEPAAIDPEATAVTLYWQAQQPAAAPRHVRLRWVDPRTGRVLSATEGRHPAGNYYPTVAWRGAEIVPDFHLLPRPFSSRAQPLDLQVAFGPPFAAGQELAWQTVTTIDVGPAAPPDLAQTLRAQNGRVLLTGAEFPAETRPLTPLPLQLSGYGLDAGVLALRLLPANMALDQAPRAETPNLSLEIPPPFLYEAQVETDLPPGAYRLISEDPRGAAVCGWLARPTAVCDLGPVVISGAPLPAGAANFDDKVALLAVDLPDKLLEPGGLLPVTLQWQGLADMDEDYTVFLQVLDSQDRLVGQVDAWPRQGTFPTSEWAPGEQVQDAYEIRLDADLPPGEYRLQVGLYLLATLRRLPVLDESGLPVDDKVVISGLNPAGPAQ